MRFSKYLPAVLFALAALPAQAQERVFNFALRGGGSVTPDYPGASSYGAGPDIGFTFGALQWGRVNIGNGIGAEPPTGLALRGAFRYIGTREAADNPELAGLRDLNAAVELGFGLIYRETNWQAHAEVRRGFDGHEGVAGTLGADLIFRPDTRWTITAGPRVNFGNREYASTYFGVTPAEAAASQFGAFNAGGGVLGAGVSVEATYQFNNDWAVQGAIRYEKLLNDAADSPITQLGSDDQWSVRIGLSRAFTLRF